MAAAVTVAGHHQATTIKSNHRATLPSSHRPRCPLFPAVFAAERLHRRSRRKHAAGARGPATVDHLTSSHDHPWMRLDTVNLPGHFLTTGAALRRPAEPDHCLPCSAVRRKTTTGAFPCDSLSHMTSGPGQTMGPTCRFKKVVVWVCIRVCLANLVRVVLFRF
jgi:hypothetical protein